MIGVFRTLIHAFVENKKEQKSIKIFCSLV